VSDDDRDPAGLKAFEDLDFLRRDELRPVRLMLELMKAEGRRLSIAYWQKINILNDIAIIAPMLGLLGTVLGMFYAFYDLNRSAESISALFDGLGISVGTTVGGLVVAIMALMFHALTKYRLTKQLIYVEAEAEALAIAIDFFHYQPLHLSDMGRKFGGKQGQCPVTEEVADRLLRLPLFHGLSAQDQGDVIAAVRGFAVG
jgi:hypothetical protein